MSNAAAIAVRALRRWQEPYTLKRMTPAASTDGRHGAPTATAIAINAVVVPATGEDLRRLPEGRMTTDVRKVFTDAVLVMDPPNEPDRIVIEGVDWEIQHREVWQEGIFVGLFTRMR